MIQKKYEAYITKELLMTLSHSHERGLSPAHLSELGDFKAGSSIQDSSYQGDIGKYGFFPIQPLATGDQSSWGVKLYVPARHPDDITQIVSLLSPYGASGERAQARSTMARRVLQAGCLGVLAFPADSVQYETEAYANSLAAINNSVAKTLKLNPEMPLTIFDHPLTEHLTPAVADAASQQGFNTINSTTYDKGDRAYFGKLTLLSLIAGQPLAIEPPRSDR